MRAGEFAAALADVFNMPGALFAHMFLQPYTLPVPFWMYVYACAATLVVSFAIVGAFVGRPLATATYRTWSVLPDSPAWQVAWSVFIGILRAGSLACLALTILAGFVGTDNPLANINMTLFWVLFLLAFTYVTALCGNLYELINPWRTLATGAARLGLRPSRPWLTYPAWLGYLPAFAFYVGLISIELFVLPQPRVLAIALIVYTAVVLAGVWLFGARAWFEYGELFAVFFGLISLVAPVEYERRRGDRPARVRLRPPLVAAIYARPRHATIVLFVLFMLSSTTYDAIHETFLWVSFYWQDFVGLLHSLWGTDVMRAQTILTWWYVAYQRLGLVLSPFVYLLFYLAVLSAARRLTRTSISLRQMAVRFAPSLVPIALVYHATHYYTVMLTQLPTLVPLASDPFGLGWQLFAVTPRVPGPIDMGVVWHTQVVLMLAGHVGGVYVAHILALRLFPTERLGIISQLPMLALMVVYTCVGLWVLSLPLDVPQIIPIG